MASFQYQKRVKCLVILWTLFLFQLSIPLFNYYLFATTRSSGYNFDDGGSTAKPEPTMSTPAPAPTVHYSGNRPQKVDKLKENACKIPTMDPYDPEMTEFFEPSTLNCKTKAYYFRSEVEETTGQPLIIRKRQLSKYLSCCYEHLRFKKSGSYRSLEFKNDTCLILTHEKTAVPLHSQYITVNCWNRSNASTESSHLKSINLKTKSVTHREILFYIPPPKIPPAPKDNSSQDKLNVIIMGFDQISRLNFIRLMGNTFRHLKSKLNAIDLQGFNKVGDATLNNTLAFMTGHMFGEVKKNPAWWKGKRDSSSHHTYFDGCPWIWKNFSRRGYLTVYGDDYPSVFNYRFKGFRRQPTDYYLHPFINWYHPKRESFGASSNCLGDEPLLHLLQDQTRKVSRSLRDHPYFHFMWNSRIHERPDYPSIADNETVRTLKYLEETGALNKSLVILLSDHGWRTGSIMMNEQARIENRMPFAFFLLPKWFRKQYSSAYANLLENQYRLTTPFDIHAALADILNYKTELNDKSIMIRQEQGKTDSPNRGISLFLPIPRERTCVHAGIDETWCACSAYKKLSKYSPVPTQLAQFATDTINSWLKPFPKCQQYKLEKVFGAELKTNSPLNTMQNTSISDVKGTHTFRLSFSLKSKEKHDDQDGPQFEVTVFLDGRHSKGDKGRLRMSTEIFRLNSYGNRAECMKIYSLKKICTCV